MNRQPESTVERNPLTNTTSGAKFSGKLQAIPDILSLAASVMTAIALITLCFTHYLYGAVFIMLCTAAGFYGLRMLINTGPTVVRVLDAFGIVVAKGVGNSASTGNSVNTGKDETSTSDQTTGRKWQTAAAAENAPKLAPERHQPTLAIPRTRQGVAKIGGEWTDE